MLDDVQKQSTVRNFVDSHNFIDKNRGSIPIKEEYRNQLGRAYKPLQKGKTLGGKPYYNTGSRALRNADIKAAERMYAAGYSRKAIANTIVKNSPITRDMTLGQRLNYKQRLNRAMNKMERLRKEVAQDKKRHGVTSNRIKDINDYGKCIQAQKHAQSRGIKSKAPTFNAFVKNSQLGDRYKANVVQQVKKQQQQKEQQKREQQKRVQQRVKEAQQRAKQSQQQSRNHRR